MVRNTYIRVYRTRTAPPSTLYSIWLWTQDGHASHAWKSYAPHKVSEELRGNIDDTPGHTDMFGLTCNDGLAQIDAMRGILYTYGSKVFQLCPTLDFALI